MLSNLRSRIEAAKLQAFAFLVSCFPESFRSDESGAMNVGAWAGLVIGAIVLIILVASLMGTLVKYLGYYAANETVFGPVVKTLTPILIGVGILLLFVYAFLRESHDG